MQQSLAIGESRDIYTPGRLNNEIKRTLETTFRTIWIEGEISNLSRPSSGHAYFSLKDARAQVRCAWFRQNQLRCPTTPENGMQVLLRARVSLYPARGDYQLLVERLEEAGRGQLQQEYESDEKADLFEQCKGHLTGSGSGYEEAASLLGMTEGALRVAVHRMRSRYRALLKAEVAATLEDPEIVDDELATLRRAIRGES